MKTIEETRRELFEAWFFREVWKDGCYGNPDILRRQLWPCWNAALDAVCIELPADCKLSRDGLDECYLAGQMRDDILHAIESTNLGLRVK